MNCYQALWTFSLSQFDHWRGRAVKIKGIELMLHLIYWIFTTVYINVESKQNLLSKYSSIISIYARLNNILGHTGEYSILVKNIKK